MEIGLALRAEPMKSKAVGWDKIRHCMGNFRGATMAGEHGKRGSGQQAS